VALRIVQVDAFTAKPFAGNPAAVCVRATFDTLSGRLSAAAVRLAA